MTSVTFFTKSGNLSGFEITGHSGFAGSGNDILCAALSAMTSLVATVMESSGVRHTFETDENIPKALLLTEDTTRITENLLSGLYREVLELAKEYPKHIRVEKREYHKGVN